MLNLLQSHKERINIPVTTHYNASSEIAQERVNYLEEKTCLTHDSSVLMIRRFEHLDMDIFGDMNTTIFKRIKALESAYFDETKRSYYK